MKNQTKLFILENQVRALEQVLAETVQKQIKLEVEREYLKKMDKDAKIRILTNQYGRLEEAEIPASERIKEVENGLKIQNLIVKEVVETYEQIGGEYEKLYKETEVNKKREEDPNSVVVTPKIADATSFVKKPKDNKK